MTRASPIWSHSQELACRDPRSRCQSNDAGLRVECETSTYHELILCLRLEVTCIVALVQLTRWLASDAIDQASALHRRPREQHVSPALNVRVFLHAQELGYAIEPALRKPAIPGKDGHVGNCVGAAPNVLVLRELAVKHVE